MAARPVARGGGSARASFGSKGDGLLLGWEMVKKAVLFVFTGLYRWLWKVAMRLWTKQGEIERLLLSGPHGAAMTRDFAGAVRASRKLFGIRDQLLHSRAPFDVTRLTTAIIEAKGIKSAGAPFHTTLLPNLSSCLQQINGTCLLLSIVDKHKSTVFDPSNVGHQVLLERVWRTLISESDEMETMSERWTEVGFQQRNPISDLRGLGLLGLEAVEYFATNYTPHAQRIINEAEIPIRGLPYAITCINMASFVDELLTSREVDWACYDLFQEGVIADEQRVLNVFFDVLSQLLVVFDQFYRDSRPENLMQFPFVFAEFRTRVRAEAAHGRLPAALHPTPK